MRFRAEGRIVESNCWPCQGLPVSQPRPTPLIIGARVVSTRSGWNDQRRLGIFRCLFGDGLRAEPRPGIGIIRAPETDVRRRDRHHWKRRRVRAVAASIIDPEVTVTGKVLPQTGQQTGVNRDGHRRRVRGKRSDGDGRFFGQQRARGKHQPVVRQLGFEWRRWVGRFRLSINSGWLHADQ